MRKLIWTPKFIKASEKFLKKNPELIEFFKSGITQIEVDPFNPILKTHKLKGSLSCCYSASINYYYRIIFEIKSEIIILLNIGTHDEVY